MRRCRSQIDDCVFDVVFGVSGPGEVVIAERKGWGHPDTLADHLAERLSGVYSRYTAEQFGAVLHHNFDKLALLGGACEVRYGSGRMLAPVRVLVNGRAAAVCGGQQIPVGDLVTQTVRDFFAERLPELTGHLRVELNVTSNPSPGSVVTGKAATDRAVWFAPRSVADLRERQRGVLCNDTSLGTGWAPEHPFEVFVRELADALSAPGALARAHPWLGSDVKVMGYAVDREIDVVVCVPQKCAHVPSRSAYLSNREVVLAECRRLACERFPDAAVRVRVNVRDLPEQDELYLTWTGSSIESGDEGVVGRGNRVSGLITPLRPMNVEGVNGKNPVYHVGKLYNVAAHRMARALAEATGGHAEVHLISATGQRLDRPWRALVRLGAQAGSVEQVTAVAAEILAGLPALTEEILTGGLVLS